MGLPLCDRDKQNAPGDRHRSPSLAQRYGKLRQHDRRRCHDDGGRPNAPGCNPPTSRLGGSQLFALSALIVRLLGGTWPDFGRLGFEDHLGFSFLAGLLYGIGEEAGWRGFALPRLQSGRSALAATLILTVFWALWHTPFFFYRFEFGAVQVIGFFMGLLAGAIWLTCLYNATGGSILMVAAWHTTWNLVNQVAMVVSVEILTAMSVMVMILAISVVVVFGPATLSPRPKQEMPSFAPPRVR